MRGKDIVIKHRESINTRKMTEAYMNSDNDDSHTNEIDDVGKFSIKWIASVMHGYFNRKEKDPSKIQIVDFKVEKNRIQGILSTAYLLDVLYKDENPPLGTFSGKRRISVLTKLFSTAAILTHFYN